MTPPARAARFVNRDRHAFAFQIKRGGQTGDAGADDGTDFMLVGQG